MPSRASGRGRCRARGRGPAPGRGRRGAAVSAWTRSSCSTRCSSSQLRSGTGSRWRRPRSRRVAERYHPMPMLSPMRLIARVDRRRSRQEFGIRKLGRHGSFMGVGRDSRGRLLGVYMVNNDEADLRMDAQGRPARPMWAAADPRPAGSPPKRRLSAARPRLLWRTVEGSTPLTEAVGSAQGGEVRRTRRSPEIADGIVGRKHGRPGRPAPRGSPQRRLTAMSSQSGHLGVPTASRRGGRPAARDVRTWRCREAWRFAAQDPGALRGRGWS